MGLAAKANKHRKKLVIGVIVPLLVVAGYLTFLYSGILQVNYPSRSKYPIKGVDVSCYQGKIDWPMLAQQEIDFAFIKATEGSSFVDTQFEYNWENALTTELKIGGYHFFSYDSSGKTQAENFMKTVPKLEGGLPPVIDIEFYGDKEENLPDRSAVTKELGNMIAELEDYYGVKPVLYVTEKSYNLYIKDNFSAYPIWARSVYKKLDFVAEDEWLFWQYSNRKKIKGYDGKEEFIDMNVFNGTIDEFNELFLDK